MWGSIWCDQRPSDEFAYENCSLANKSRNVKVTALDLNVQDSVQYVKIVGKFVAVNGRFAYDILSTLNWLNAEAGNGTASFQVMFIGRSPWLV